MPTWIPPTTIVPGTPEDANQLTSIFTSLQNTINALDDANLSATAGIQASKLATGSTGLARGAFSAYRAAAVSLATGAVVVFDTDGTAPGFDVSNWYDTATGIYTPQAPGYYRFSASVGAAGILGADVSWQASLLKNGGELHRGQPCYQRGTTANAQSVVTGNAVANGTTDNFKVSILHGVGAATGIAATALTTYFHAELIGPS